MKHLFRYLKELRWRNAISGSAREQEELTAQAHVEFHLEAGGSQTRPYDATK